MLLLADIGVAQNAHSLGIGGHDAVLDAIVDHLDEVTGAWKPVWQVLADSSFELILANAAQVKNVPGRKTDVNDATWLAELLAHGLVRASFVPEPT
jgi:hypothetical protein